jgi:non-specific serine/threonine protein kinase
LRFFFFVGDCGRCGGDSGSRGGSCGGSCGGSRGGSRGGSCGGWKYGMGGMINARVACKSGGIISQN